MGRSPTVRPFPTTHDLPDVDGHDPPDIAGRLDVGAPTSGGTAAAEPVGARDGAGDGRPGDP